MKYEQFTEIVRRNGWTIPDLRCDVRPSDEILEFIERVGLDYETFVMKYAAVDTNLMHRYAAEDFPSPITQREMLLNGSREDIIQWLIWNDRNGVWSDSDSAAEGRKPMSLEDARNHMRSALGGSPSELKIADSTSNDFDPNLPAGATDEDCKVWLRKLCRDFGLGFHPDTPATDYINQEGVPLPREIASALDNSLDRAFEILGGEMLCDVCAEVFEDMMSKLIQCEAYPCQSNGQSGNIQQ